jgi:hypothetical protein
VHRIQKDKKGKIYLSQDFIGSVNNNGTIVAEQL